MKTIDILENLGKDATFEPSKLDAQERLLFQKFIMNQPGFHAPMLTPAEDEPDQDSEDEPAKSITQIA